MKKLLALVLALVMTLSLCVTSNAAFTDAADVDYKEAVDVMSAVGVFVGDGSGKFDPDGALTRAAAAKLVAYLTLGQKAADALQGSGKVFSDVAASNWACGYIEYCAAAGYLAGVGEGKFDPNGALTGVAFAKLMLCCLGYDATAEGYVGSTWAINVVKQANALELFADEDKSVNAVVTRQEAAAMMLNTLKSQMVYYAGGSSITINDVAIKQGATLTPVTDANHVGFSVTEIDEMGTPTKLELGEYLYAGKLEYDHAGTGDAFGRTAMVWTYKGDEVGTYTTLKADYTATVTDNTAFTVETVTTDGELTTVGNKLDKVLGITATNKKLTSIDEQEFYVNGVAVANDGDVVLNAGDQVEVYLVDGHNTDVTKVVVLRQSFAKILDVKANTGKAKAAKTDANGDRMVYDYKITIDTTNDGNANITTNNLDLKGYTAEYVKGAYLNLYLKNTAVIGSSVAETKTGALTAFSATKNATMDGTKYLFANAGIPGHSETIDYKNGNYTLVLDDAGYVTAVIENEGDAPTLENVYYALGNSWTTSATAYDTTKKTVYQQVVALDGTVKDVVVGGYTFHEGADDTNKWGNGSIPETEGNDKYTYTPVTGLVVMTKTAATATVDEYYTLDETAGASAIDTSSNNYAFKGNTAGTGVSLASDAKKFDSKYVTADTKVILINNKVAASNTKATVNTGVIGYTSGASELYDVLSVTTSKGTEVVAIVFAGSSQITSNSEVLFVKSATTTTNADGYAQTAYKMDGTKVDITIVAGDKDLTGFVTYTVDKDGVYDLADATGTLPESATFNKNTTAHKDNFEGATFAKSYYGEEYITLNGALDYSLIDIPADKAVVVDLRTDDAKEANYDADIESVADIYAAASTYAVGTEDNNVVTLNVRTTADGAVIIFVVSVLAPAG